MGKTIKRTAQIFLIGSIMAMSACSMQSGSAAGISSSWQPLCATRNYYASNGQLVANPADASTFQSYNYFFCADIKLDIQSNSISLRLNQIVNNYGGGAIRVMGRTLNMDTGELVQVITDSTMNDAMSNLESGQTVVLDNISGGTANVVDYVEWSLVSENTNQLLDQDSYVVTCNGTASQCAGMAPTIRAQNWAEAANVLDFAVTNSLR